VVTALLAVLLLGESVTLMHGAASAPRGPDLRRYSAWVGFFLIYDPNTNLMRVKGSNETPTDIYAVLSV
jgi:hypothetical protein